MTETWILFEDSSAYPLICNINGNGKNPVSTYLISNNHTDEFLASANRACSLVHSYFHSHGQPIGNQVITFDLLGRNDQALLSGKSGGLAFAAAFACRLLNIDSSKIAATGVIEADNRVTKVKGIENKLSKALTFLDKGDCLFFPKSCRPEISGTLLSELENKKIRLFPIDRVSQLMEVLLKLKKKSADGELLRHKPLERHLPTCFMWFAITIFIGLAILSIYFFHGQWDRGFD